MKKALGTKIYYSISEVAEITELQPYTLRAWEKEFPCLRPRRNRGKNRAYRGRDIGIILLIKHLLYEERYSTHGVRKKLKSEPELLRHAADHVAALPQGTSLRDKGAEISGDVRDEDMTERRRNEANDLLKRWAKSTRKELRGILELLR